MRPDVEWICDTCALASGGEYIPGHVMTYHEGVCEVCDTTQSVTEPRDFRWVIRYSQTAKGGPVINPCPFCGAEGVMVITGVWERFFAVECSESTGRQCGAEGPPKWTEEDAIAAWNTRVSTNVPETSK